MTRWIGKRLRDRLVSACPPDFLQIPMIPQRCGPQASGCAARIQIFDNDCLREMMPAKRNRQLIASDSSFLIQLTDFILT
jgi:hypothetical protein